MRISLNKQSKDKTISQAFEEFLFLKKVENVTEETINDYKTIFSIFSNFVGESIPCGEITLDTIQEYVSYLKTKPKKQNGLNKMGEKQYLSSVTIATYIRHLRVVLYMFMEKGYTNTFKIKVPRYEKDVKEVYSPNEIEKLLVKPDVKSCSFSEYRNWVITNYLLSTANRIATVVNLKIADLNFEDEEVYLNKVKNRKRYTVPMQQDLKKILLEYLGYRKGGDNDFLFCSEKDDKKPMTTDALKHAIARYNLKRGVTKTSAHIYRNTFAKHWILNGGDLVRLQKILGHSNLNMVLEYVEMFGRDLQLNFNDYNPLSIYSKGKHISLRKQ